MCGVTPEFVSLSKKGDEMKRSRISSGKSKRLFSKTADRTHKKNVPSPRRMPMRGGIRL